MNYRTYGKLGWKVSALGLGCMRLPRIYDGSDVAQGSVYRIGGDLHRSGLPVKTLFC